MFLSEEEVENVLSHQPSLLCVNAEEVLLAAPDVWLMHPATFKTPIWLYVGTFINDSKEINNFN